MNLLKPKRFTGVDIRPNSLRLLQLRRLGTGLCVERTAACDLPAPLFTRACISDFDALSAALAPVVKRAGLQGAAAALSLPVHLVYRGNVRLPAGLADKAMKAQLQAELMRELACKEPLGVDSRREEEYRKSSYLRLHYAAVRQRYAEQYREALRAAGLHIKIIEVDIFALQRVLNSVQKDGGLRAVIMLDHKAAGMLVYAENIQFYTGWPLTHGDLLSQAAASLQFYTACYPGEVVSQCTRCNLRGNAGLEFAPQAPPAFLTMQHPTEYMIAAGLAMRGLES